MHLALKRRSISYGWEGPRPRLRSPRWKRAAMWFGVVSATALVTALVASAVTPGLPYRVARAVQHHFAPQQPLSRLVVSEYVRQTREAAIWDRRPLIYPPSVAYFENHFMAFDPRHEHAYRKTRFQLWVRELVHEAPIFVGFPVEVAGVIRSLNILGPAMPNRRVEWIVQLGGITVERSGLIYCRVTEPIKRQLYAGDIVTASGLILGAGSIRLMNGQRENGVYMACSAIRQPRGAFGRYARFLEHHPRAWAKITKRNA